MYLKLEKTTGDNHDITKGELDELLSDLQGQQELTAKQMNAATDSSIKKSYLDQFKSTQHQIDFLLGLEQELANQDNDISNRYGQYEAKQGVIALDMAELQAEINKLKDSVQILTQQFSTAQPGQAKDTAKLMLQRTQHALDMMVYWQQD